MRCPVGYTTASGSPSVRPSASFRGAAIAMVGGGVDNGQCERRAQLPSCYRRGPSLGEAPPRRRAVVAQSFVTFGSAGASSCGSRSSMLFGGWVSRVGYQLATKPPETGRTRSPHHPRAAARKWASPRRSGSAEVFLVRPRRGFVIDRSSVQVRSSAPVFPSLRRPFQPHETVTRSAEQTVYHDSERASALVFRIEGEG